MVALECRLGEGGLLRRLEAACHLTRLRTQIISALAVTWLPITVLSLLEEHTTGRREAIFYHSALHVRLLVAVPIFLLLDRLFPVVCRRMLEMLVSQSFIPPLSLPRFERSLRRAVGLTDSTLPEAILALLGVGLGIATLLRVIPIVGINQRLQQTPAQIWHALVDIPVFQFLLWRSLWRWAVWIRVLADLSRMDLRLIPTHPDRCGGIAFLRFPSIDYCTMLLFAASSVLSAEWGTRFSMGATLETFKPLLLVFGSVATLLAFGPLLMFMPLLWRARREGGLDVTALVAHMGRTFETRWVEAGGFARGRPLEARQGEEPSLGFEAQSLSAMIQSYRETVIQMRVFIFDRYDVIRLLVATLLPAIPVMVMHVPWEDWRGLLELLTGGWIR